MTLLFLKKESRKVIFSAVRKSSSRGPGYLTFSELVINEGNGFSLSDSTFRVPIAGTYAFSFSCQVYHEKTLSLDVLLNGTKVWNIFQSKMDGNSALSASWMIKMNKGDTLRLKHRDKNTKILSDGEWHVYFNGQLVKPSE